MTGVESDVTQIQVNDFAPFEISIYPLKITPARYELQVVGQ
jgi:hypothetical protein